MTERIDPLALVPMDLFTANEPVVIDLVYARADHPENIFGIAAYHAEARFSLHTDLARIVLRAARRLYERFGWKLVLKDGLRVIEAQKTLIETDIVRANPHWLETPRLLSGPGQGAHPRGMAIDLGVQGGDGQPVDMGTGFDAMVPESARSFAGFDPAILNNRHVLERAMTESAAHFSLPILPLPSEWWDFRFPPEYTSRFAPLSDEDLPPSLRMIAPAAADGPEQTRLDALAKSVLAKL